MARGAKFPSPDKVPKSQLHKHQSATADYLWNLYFRTPPGLEAIEILHQAMSAASSSDSGDSEEESDDF